MTFIVSFIIHPITESLVFLKMKPYPLSLVLMLMILGNASWCMMAQVFDTDAWLRLMRM